MKLFIYDHCPYCTKARMIFGLKNIAVELVTLLNDDEANPIRMIGKKMVPILEVLPGQFMPESLDIVSFVDRLEHYKPQVNPSAGHADLNQWLQDARRYLYHLAMPRWAQMGLAEFATPGAVDYFVNKKEKSIGSFRENWDHSAEYIAMAEAHLQKLEEMIPGGPFFWGSKLRIDDFHVFATLRCLTSVKGLRFPKKVEAYTNHMSAICKVPLHWNLAL